MDKSQISVFFIVAIIVLLSGIIMIHNYNDITDDNKFQEKLREVPYEAKPIYNFVEDCIDNVALPGIFLLGLQGGSLYLSNDTFTTNNNKITYHMDNGKDIMPSLNDIEKQISRFIQESINTCIKDFYEFNDQGYEISGDGFNAETNIQESSISIKLDNLIKIKNGDSITEIREFKRSYPIRLGYIYQINQEIVNHFIEGNDWINFNAFNNLGVDITLIPYSGNTMVISIIDANSTIKERKFTYLFALKLEVNSPPKLEFIPDFLIAKGSLFTYDINATDADNDALSYYSENAMIDVNKENGIFSFNPPIDGEYDIEICVKDTFENSDCRNMRFIIKDV